MWQDGFGTGIREILVCQNQDRMDALVEGRGRGQS